MPETTLPIAGVLRDQQYDVEREIGRGGMATVYLAQDRKHGRRVAIKVLDQALTSGAERFLREIRIIARLNHPHVLPMFDSGQAGPFLYYVMPYVDGESLRGRLRRETRLPIGESVRLASEVADALDYAHGEGVIHRDVKPENILLFRGHALVADFGIARAVSAATDSPQATLTQIGIAVGTPAYMSPEQAFAERELGPQTDIYSLACVLFEMIGGAPPFSGMTPAAVVAKRFRGAMPSLALATPGLPPGIEAAIARALAIEPRDRFSTAAEFAAALAQSGAGAVMTTHSLARASVAVLPFAALTAGTDDAYFSDGVTEDLITRLGKIKTLKVISRNSVMRFKGSLHTTREIANALGVQALVQGSVRRAGDRLRVTAQLIDATTDEHLWADAYDRRITDVFDVQADVAESIAAALAAELSPVERERLRHSPEMDVETYNLCLLGRHHWHRWTEPDFQESIAYYKQALTRSSDSAMAHSGLGICYATLGLGYWSVRGTEYHPLAKRALQRAVALDSDFPDAQAWLGYLDRQYDFAWNRAERRLRQALNANANSAMLHDVLSNVLTATGRHAESRDEWTRACELDPLSYFLLANAALAAYRERDYDASVQLSRRGIALDPNLPMLHALMGLPLLQLGRAEEALVSMDLALQMKFAAVEPLKVPLLAAVGRQQEARELLRTLEERRLTEHVWPFALAVAHAHLGDNDSAFDCLNDAYSERDFWVGWLAVEPSLDRLRSDQRFTDLLRLVNLAGVGGQ